MRLMLGQSNSPTLLVDVKSEYDKNNFEFYVINGNWYGVFTKGNITVLDCPSGSYSSIDKMEIICDNRNRLLGCYQDVFYNFDDANYVAPKKEISDETQNWLNSLDDDIPF
jgi:hypothetical protein